MKNQKNDIVVKKVRPCTKKAYKDKDQALSAIHIIASRGDDRSCGYKPIRYYKCAYCKHYHITHQTFNQYNRYGNSDDEL